VQLVISNTSIIIKYQNSNGSYTTDISTEEARDGIQEGLLDSSCAFVYHCFNHYMIIVGYDKRGHNGDMYIHCADSSAIQPAIHSIEFSDIETDLSTEYPEYYNV